VNLLGFRGAISRPAVVLGQLVPIIGMILVPGELEPKGFEISPVAVQMNF
jgi:hypothetical protein